MGESINRFDEFAIKPFRSLPPNGYGLYGMYGSVWEWTNDAYDALSYSKTPLSTLPMQPPEDRSDRAKPDHGLPERVLRGGSWSNAADAATMSFRVSWRSVSWRARPHAVAAPGAEHRLPPHRRMTENLHPSSSL
jgi:sulfatase modifying factor 1